MVALEEALVQVLAKKKGIPEEEAKLLLEAMKEEGGDSDLKEAIAALAEAGMVAQSLPPSLQPLAMQMFAAQLAGGKKGDDIAERIALITAAMNTVKGDDKYEKLFEELRKELQELKEEKKREEQEAIIEAFKETMQSFEDYVKALERRIEAIESGRNEEGKDDIDKFVELWQKMEEKAEKLRKLGLVAEQQDVDPEQLAKVLEKYGYRVERPPDWHQMQRMLEEELRRREEQIRKELEEKLKLEEKKMTMAMDFISALLDGIIGATTSRSGAVQRFVEVLRGVGGAGQAADATGTEVSLDSEQTD